MKRLYTRFSSDNHKLKLEIYILMDLEMLKNLNIFIHKK